MLRCTLGSTFRIYYSLGSIWLTNCLCLGQYNRLGEENALDVSSKPLKRAFLHKLDRTILLRPGSS